MRKNYFNNYQVLFEQTDKGLVCTVVRLSDNKQKVFPPMVMFQTNEDLVVMESFFSYLSEENFEGYFRK